MEPSAAPVTQPTAAPQADGATATGRKKRRGFGAAAAPPAAATVGASVPMAQHAGLLGAGPPLLGHTPSGVGASMGAVSTVNVVVPQGPPGIPPHIKVATEVAEAARVAAIGYVPPVLSTEETQQLNAMRQYVMQETVNYRRQLDQLRIECNPLMAQQQAAAKQQAFASMCRVFVSNINPTTTQAAITTAFEPFGPVRGVELPYEPTTGGHKGFGFVDYEHPEGAEMAITQMNLQDLDSRQIRVSRPAPLMPLAQQMVTDPRNNTRIYVSSVFSELSDSDIHTVFEAFGEIKSCIMCPDPANAGRHRGFGFIEFDNEASAVDAIGAMHNFDLAGVYIRVCKAITLPELCPWLQVKPQSAGAVAAAAAAAEVTKALGRGENGAAPSMTVPSTTMDTEPEHTTLEQDENIGISGATQRYMMMQKLAEKTGSRVIVLRNMVEKEDVDETLEEEVKEECEKHGPVEKVLIYEEFDQTTGTTIIKLFVKFGSNDSARKCIAALNGRFFAGKVVTAEEYDEDRYTAKDYTG
eukprot:m.65094 g.65094  ORF g.65094 m.65094 type:complete len:525 (+) comp8266_c0_seq1:430-2004(+)